LFPLKYKFLESINIGPLTLRNRIIRPAVAEYIANPDGSIGDQYMEYYRNIARGGVALITPGIAVVDETAPYVASNQPYLTDKKYIPGMKKVVDAIHGEGAKITFQLWHSGHYLIDGALAPMVNDLTKQDIERLKQKYLTAAKNCKEAGADGVEYHIAHTYLPSQFMSTYFNRRTDEYGSNTPENAMRFSVECINMIRNELCDDNFIITAKINGSDFVEGGTTPQWAARCARLLEKAGVAMITVNAGGALSGYDYMSDNGKRPEGWKVDLAATVKKAVTVPVAASGSLRHPEYVSKIIEQDKCDLAALGRATIAEPEWVNKAAQSREDEMRYCISCLYCFTKVAEDGSEPGCSVNPFAKCEFIKPEPVADGHDRKVVIIGAGPSGLEAAITLAERGFNISIFEQKPYLGGLIKLATVPPNKTKINWAIDYYEKQIQRLDIDLKLSTRATIEKIEKLNPYAVILAAGSNEIVPLVEGAGLDNVISVRDLLEQKLRFDGKKVAVIGAGLTGIEAAHYLRNSNSDVYVVEKKPDPGATRSLADQLSFQDALAGGVKFYFQTFLHKINKNSITVLDLASNKKITLPADIVMPALGIRSNVELYDALKNKFENVYKIGDSDCPGKLPQAVRSGSNLGYALK
jgi:2,4-dienoyl-CoA reductase-like NADH-dependent reductase (Old Yellow Enzyme family)/thioredoxin reductase